MEAVGIRSAAHRIGCDGGAGITGRNTHNGMFARQDIATDHDAAASGFDPGCIAVAVDLEPVPKHLRPDNRPVGIG